MIKFRFLTRVYRVWPVPTLDLISLKPGHPYDPWICEPGLCPCQPLSAVRGPLFSLVGFISDLALSRPCKCYNGG